jgi:CBS domain-containing protein
MADKQIRRVPVLDMELVVGMVTLADIVRSAQAHPVRGVLALPSISKTFAAITAPRHVAAAAE